MAKVAILGYGTVGAASAQLLRECANSIAARALEPVELKYVVDLRQPSGADAALWRSDIADVLADGEVTVVVEAIGGTVPAYDFVSRCLDTGKSVVTSNKELIATYGDALTERAKKAGVNLLYEASVGGAIPEIAALCELCADEVESVCGILNGTTNFMLSEMQRTGASFDAALKQAQQLGYAETVDPSADVDGIDALRKICILAALCFGEHFEPQSVGSRGIRSVTPLDMELCASIGGKVKLVAAATKVAGGVQMFVEPCVVRRGDLLFDTDGVLNMVKIKYKNAGELSFGGAGAGGRPTASAVIADVARAVRCKGGTATHDWPGRGGARLVTDLPADWYVRAPLSAGARLCGETAFAREQENNAYHIKALTRAALEEKLADADAGAALMRVLG